MNARTLYGILVIGGGVGLLAVIAAKWMLPAANLKVLLVATIAMLSIGLVGQMQRPARATFSRGSAALRKILAN